MVVNTNQILITPIKDSLHQSKIFFLITNSAAATSPPLPVAVQITGLLTIFCQLLFPFNNL